MRGLCTCGAGARVRSLVPLWIHLGQLHPDATETERKCEKDSKAAETAVHSEKMSPLLCATAQGLCASFTVRYVTFLWLAALLSLWRPG